MDQFEKQKEYRMALNGKMILMMTGLLLVFSAVTSTSMYAANMFAIAGEAVKGTKEYVDALAQIGMAPSTARMIGGGFFVIAAVEICVGVFCARLSNRLDKSRFVFKMVVLLLVVEILMQVMLLFVGLFNPAMLIRTVIIPVFMIWAVLKLRKLAKKYPDRVYAVETNKNKKNQEGQTNHIGQASTQKKSLRERAMMQTVRPEESEETEEAEEAEIEEVEKTETGEVKAEEIEVRESEEIIIGESEAEMIEGRESEDA